MTSTWLPIGIDNAGLFRNVFGNQVSLGSAGIVTSVTGGTGITVTGTASAPVINNTGVLSVAAGTGISSTGGQNPSISNTGIITVTAGTGISSTGGQNPTLTNTGVLSATAGNGIQLTGTASAPVVNTYAITTITGPSLVSFTAVGTTNVAGAYTATFDAVKTKLTDVASNLYSQVTITLSQWAIGAALPAGDYYVAAVSAVPALFRPNIAQVYTIYMGVGTTMRPMLVIIYPNGDIYITREDNVAAYPIVDYRLINAAAVLLPINYVANDSNFRCAMSFSYVTNT